MNDMFSDEFLPVRDCTTFIDLFAGLGGFRLALEKKHLQCVFSSEIDKYAQEMYCNHFGDLPHGDITRIDAMEVPKHDVLCAGFPCQPFSLAGRVTQRRISESGEADDRKNLFWEIMRIARWHKPRIMLLENVPGLRQGKMFPVYEQMLEAIGNSGYTCNVMQLDSSDYGIPQKRVRLYFVCVRKDLHYFPSYPQKVKLRKPLKTIMESDVDEKYYLSDVALKGLVKHAEQQKEKGNGFAANFVSGNDISPTLLSRYHKDGSNCLIRVGIMGNDRQGKRVYSSDGVAITQSANGGGFGTKTGLYNVNERVRRLTPREAFRVMGLPDEYEIIVSDSQAYKLAGNSIIPRMVELVWDGIRSHEHY